MMLVRLTGFIWSTELTETQDIEQRESKEVPIHILLRASYNHEYAQREVKKMSDRPRTQDHI